MLNLVVKIKRIGYRSIWNKILVHLDAVVLLITNFALSGLVTERIFLVQMNATLRINYFTAISLNKNEYKDIESKLKI